MESDKATSSKWQDGKAGSAKAAVRQAACGKAAKSSAANGKAASDWVTCDKAASDNKQSGSGKQQEARRACGNRPGLKQQAVRGKAGMRH